jgi:hypothetical protein
VKTGWRKLHNEEVHDFYFSLSTVRHIISTRMKWRAGSSVQVMRLYMPREFLFVFFTEDSPLCLRTKIVTVPSNTAKFFIQE